MNGWLFILYIVVITIGALYTIAAFKKAKEASLNDDTPNELYWWPSVFGAGLITIVLFFGLLKGIVELL